MGREPTSTVGVALRTMSREGGTRRVAGGSFNCSAIQLLTDRLRDVGIEHGCALELLRRRVDIGKAVKWRNLPHRSADATAYTYADVDTYVLCEPLSVRRGTGCDLGIQRQVGLPRMEEDRENHKMGSISTTTQFRGSERSACGCVSTLPEPGNERFSPPSSNGLGVSMLTLNRTRREEVR